VCIAPATAHDDGEAGARAADDLVTNTCLATRAPLVIAPLWDCRYVRSPGRQANVKLLRERGAIIVEQEAYGRMASDWWAWAHWPSAHDCGTRCGSC